MKLKKFWSICQVNYPGLLAFRSICFSGYYIRCFWVCKYHHFLTFIFSTCPSACTYHILISFGVKFNIALSSQVSCFDVLALRRLGFSIDSISHNLDAPFQVNLWGNAVITSEIRRFYKYFPCKVVHIFCIWEAHHSTYLHCMLILRQIVIIPVIWGFN